jgi:hypothetical protein
MWNKRWLWQHICPKRYQSQKLPPGLVERKSLVQKLVKQQQTERNLQLKQREKPQFSHLTNAEAFVKALVTTHE